MERRSTIFDRQRILKQDGVMLNIMDGFNKEIAHIDEIIEKLRTGITNYSKSKKN